MSNETPMTIIGFLTSDPELKSTQGGLSVVNVTIASTPSKYNKDTNAFVDGETLFMRATAWRIFAEQIAASLKKGDKVVGHGNIVSESYVDKEGKKRTSTRLDLQSLGLDLSRPPKTAAYSEVRGTNNAAAASSWAEASQDPSDAFAPF